MNYDDKAFKRLAREYNADSTVLLSRKDSAILSHILAFDSIGGELTIVEDWHANDECDSQDIIYNISYNGNDFNFIVREYNEDIPDFSYHEE
jgi:hypothetical protein